MFTIKHVTTLGNEELHTTKACGCYPFPEPQPVTGAPPPNGGDWEPLTAKVWFERTPDEHRELLGGMVYVMNENGATVSKWDLGGWAAPA